MKVTLGFQAGQVTAGSRSVEAGCCHRARRDMGLLQWQGKLMRQSQESSLVDARFIFVSAN